MNTNMRAGEAIVRPPVDASLQAPLRALVRSGVWIVGAWCLGLGLWAGLAPISGGVVATGMVKVEANRRTVTHRDGGTVARISVREGQLVQRGEVLIELEDVRVEASVDLLRAQLAADRLRQARLEAEAAGRAEWHPPTSLKNAFSDVASFDEQASKERLAFDARQAGLRSQVEGERAQAEDTRTEISVRLKERENSSRALGLMREELAVNQRLEQEQFVNRARVLSMQRAVSEYESRQLGNEAELSQARQRLGALEARIRGLRESLAQQSSEELRQVGARVADTEQRLRASADDRIRQRVLAPETGRLVNLRVNTAGSAIGAREAIVDIVPSDAPLHVEVRLAPDAAAEVRQGTPAEIKLLAPHARYDKLLPATVAEVSADALLDERSGGAFVVALLHVDLPASEAALAGLRPGMAAEVYIKTVERTPLGYLVEPMAGYFRRAFRER
jgi:HlyD family type I secretion membrane fusion protein